MAKVYDNNRPKFNLVLTPSPPQVSGELFLSDWMTEPMKFHPIRSDTLVSYLLEGLSHLGSGDGGLDDRLALDDAKKLKDSTEIPTLDTDDAEFFRKQSKRSVKGLVAARDKGFEKHLHNGSKKDQQTGGNGTVQQ